MVYGIFNNVSDNDIIKSWRNHYDQKSDIFIKIGNIMKGVSIKMGSRNSVHVEHIDKFTMFLSENGLSKDLTNDYLKYHYADGSFDNTGNKRLSSIDYKERNPNSVNNFNNYINKANMLYKAIDRFVVKGNNSKYRIDAIVYGIPSDFLWISRKDIFKVLLDSDNNNCTSPHFGNLICQPKNRCLNHNQKYENDRNYVQIKWYSIFDDIIKVMNKKVLENRASDQS